MSTRRDNLEELLKAMFGEEISSQTSKKESKTKVKTLLTDEQIGAFNDVSNALSHLTEVLMRDDDISRLMDANKNDANMFQYVVFHDLIVELIQTTKAVEDLLKFTEEDIENMCREHGCSVAETVTKVMIADIISKL